MFALSELKLARRSLGLDPTSGSGQSPYIRRLKFGGYVIVCYVIAVCVMFTTSDLKLARGSFGFAPASGMGQSP